MPEQENEPNGFLESQPEQTPVPETLTETPTVTEESPIIDNEVAEEPDVFGNKTEPFTDHAETIDGYHAGHNSFYQGSDGINPDNPLATVAEENWAADVNRENR